MLNERNNANVGDQNDGTKANAGEIEPRDSGRCVSIERGRGRSRGRSIVSVKTIFYYYKDF